jgi:hypothetical protein
MTSIATENGTALNGKGAHLKENGHAQSNGSQPAKLSSADVIGLEHEYGAHK